MNPQLAALFAAHKTAIFGTAAAGAVGLGLWTKKKAAAKPTTSAGSTTSIGGTIPAAAVVPATGFGGSYDSSAFDAYNALQPELEQILQTRGGGITTAPDPATSALLKPTSNNAWESQAIEGWVGAGQNPLDLQAALSQYVAGQPLNQAQASGIGWTIKNYGTAPEGTQGVSRVVPA